MVFKKTIMFVAGCMLVTGLCLPQAQASIFIHEILADPPAIGGDANGDGIISISADEFVELYNDSGQAVNLSGWSISDALKTRHIFPENTWVDPLSVFLIFSGGSPAFDSSLHNTASSGSLGLNNSGDAVSLLGLSGELVDTWSYGAEGGKDQSIVRIDGKMFLHTEIDADRLFSPGSVTEQDGSSHAVPEVDTWISLFAGFVGFSFFRQKNWRMFAMKN